MGEVQVRAAGVVLLLEQRGLQVWVRKVLQFQACSQKGQRQGWLGLRPQACLATSSHTRPGPAATSRSMQHSSTIKTSNMNNRRSTRAASTEHMVQSAAAAMQACTQASRGAARTPMGGGPVVCMGVPSWGKPAL